MNGTDALLTVRQLQDLLHVDRITVYRMLRSGRLRGFKVGGQWRFSRQAIEGWLQEQQAGMEGRGPSGRPEGPQPSSQMLPLSCVAAIQGILAQALDVGAVVTAPDGTPLTPLANCRTFCSLLLRTETGRRRCAESWRAAAGAAGRPQPFSCHAGLCYLSARVEVLGQIVAAAHAGQFLEQPPTDAAWAGRLGEIAAACGLDAGSLRQALDRVPVLPRQQQEQLARLLGRAAATFAEIGQERMKLLGRLQRIAEMTHL